MASLHLTALLALSLSLPAFAQTTQVTWASIIYTLHGETTPSITTGPYNLSPLGANQSLAAGALIRDRYIDPSNSSTLQPGGAVPINGISVDEIDNSQLYALTAALSTDEGFMSASALAFFQGLYPPVVGAGDADESRYPLGGYQYPNIGTVSTLDFNYIWIAGHLNCPNYEIASIEAKNSAVNLAMINSTLEFYASLAPDVFWAFDASDITYYNAALLYEYASYQYNHNSSAPISSDNLKTLYKYASQQQFELNTPNDYGTIPAIAGGTLAAGVLQQFGHVISSGGSTDKLTLWFGYYEPMLSFFSLSGLSTGPSASIFQSIPAPGSSLAFELFSYSSTAQNASTPFPSTSELMVRVLFRDGSGSSNPLIEYSVFGNSNEDNDLSWDEFVSGLGKFSLDDVVDWCTSCGALTLFCEGIEANLANDTLPSVSPSNSNSLTPAIGGVIGATVTLALLVLAVGVLALTGFRLEYRKRPRGEGGEGAGVLRRSGSGGAGGFKGAEKLASDTDLRLKGGAGASVVRHERVGSWELREGGDKHLESGGMERVVSGADYGRRSEEVDRVDPFGDPVKPVDTV